MHPAALTFDLLSTEATPPLTRLRGGAWLCGAGRRAERPSSQLCLFALCRSRLSSAPVVAYVVAGYKEKGHRQHEIAPEHESDGGQQRDKCSLTGQRLDTELRRCAHWILPTKECRDRGETGGLYRADGVPAGISLDVSLNMDEGEDFTEQQIVGLPDKIPLVKPYFKKKQRKLDAKCLHRALEDPILTTLLSTDTLVSGDGVFVPRNQPGRTPGNLCAAAVVKQNCMGQVCLKDPGAADDSAGAGAGVPDLMTRDGDVEIADTTAELEETERRGERPKISDPTPDSRCFQLKPALRAAGTQ
ncbi:hypothetical protein INR49_018718 [Caranx melampygus]|nr:hypothetical protein INR49_018718 [Caranx melampygus]